MELACFLNRVYRPLFLIQNIQIYNFIYLLIVELEYVWFYF